jgi:hypothetical protein
MKKSALNLLWQQKRNELPIDQDPQADWAGMQQILDVQMPVGNGVVATQSISKAILTHIAKFKLLYALATLLVAGTITYFLIDRSFVVQTNQDSQQEIKKGNIIIAADKNSQLQNTSSNKVAIVDSATNKTIGDYSNATSNGAEKYLDNKTKVSVPANNTGITATGVSAPGINNSDNKSLPRIHNGKSTIAKTSTFNNKTSSLSPGDKRNAIGPGRNGALPPSHSNYGHLSNDRFNFRNSVSQIVDRDNTQRDVREIGVSGPGTDRPATGLQDYVRHQPNADVIQLWPPQLFSWDINDLLIKNSASKLTTRVLDDSPYKKALASAKIKNKRGLVLPIDWGLLAGINAPGSFTPANNKNTNGVPFDAYGGLFATYDLNNKWSVNLQARLPSPHLARGNYSHTEAGKTDTGTMKTVNSKITDARKMYMVDIPLYLVYHASPNIDIKAGPVVSIPLTEANGIGTVTTSGTPKDSIAYIVKMSDALNNSSIKRTIYYGLSGGVSVNYGRFLLDATFYHNFQAQKVSSSLGGYTSNNNSLQIAIGFRLNKKRQ